MPKKLISLFSVFFILSACGGSGGGTSNGTDSIPTQISWTEPQQNTDAGDLTDLASYRIYYGPDANSLQPITDLDLPANSANPDPGATVTHVFTSSDIAIMTPIVEANSTHYFALTAINSQGIESSFSEIVQYDP